MHPIGLDRGAASSANRTFAQCQNKSPMPRTWPFLWQALSAFSCRSDVVPNHFSLRDKGYSNCCQIPPGNCRCSLSMYPLQLPLTSPQFSLFDTTSLQNKPSLHLEGRFASLGVARITILKAPGIKGYCGSPATIAQRIVGIQIESLDYLFDQGSIYCVAPGSESI